MLEHCTEVHAMNAIIGIFYRYSVIWACMDEVSTIVAALDSAHQLWKQRGIQSRPLLTLITQLDNDRYLSAASRERNAADVSAFALVGDFKLLCRVSMSYLVLSLGFATHS